MALGIVLTPYGGKAPVGQLPWEVSSSDSSNWPQLQPFDPQYNTRGEQGFYPDTHLGGRGGLGTIAGAAIRVAPPVDQQRQRYAQLVGSTATLGALPTDAEMGRDRCATPVMSGWIQTNRGFVAPPWIPGIGPGPGLGQAGGYTLRDGALVPTTPAPTPQTPTTIEPTPALPPGFNVVAAEERHRQRMFLLQVISVTAVVAVSVINFYRSAKAIKQDRI